MNKPSGTSAFGEIKWCRESGLKLFFGVCDLMGRHPAFEPNKFGNVILKSAKEWHNEVILGLLFGPTQKTTEYQIANVAM